jgi:hypothetical protein
MALSKVPGAPPGASLTVPRPDGEPATGLGQGSAVEDHAIAVGVVDLASSRVHFPEGLRSVANDVFVGVAVGRAPNLQRPMASGLAHQWHERGGPSIEGTGDVHAGRERRPDPKHDVVGKNVRSQARLGRG